MSELIVSRENRLPANIEDLSKFVLVGREKLVAVRAEIRAIQKVGLAQEVREQKLREAQDISEAVLDAEVRIGELMARVPKTQGRRNDLELNNTVVKKSKAEVISDMGFTPMQVSRFETLAAHPELVEQAKAEARENDDIVSRSLVLEKVKQKKREENRQKWQEEITDQVEAPKTDRHVDIFTTDKKYRVIYADPPWSYGDKQNIEGLGGAVKHYPTMPLQDICTLPVPAADNAVLFLWVTSPLLEDSFKVISAWGFKYKSSFVWDKVAHNMGHYNSVRHEFLLIATRGSCTPDVPKLFDSVVSIERTEHSRKPQEFREMIDTLYPVGERLEMFAREASEGWDVWGNMA
jgi:N6-adenosine-specific RNA methylase IME4